MKIANLKVGARLGAGFGFVLLLLALALATGAQRLHHVGQATTTLVDEDWVKAEAAGTINTLTRANARRTLELFIAPDKARRDQIRERIEANKKDIGVALDMLQRLISSAEGWQLLQQVSERRAGYIESFSKVSSLIEAGQGDEARQLVLAETLPRLDSLQESVQTITAYQRKRADEAGNAVRADIDSGIALMLILGAVALVAGKVSAVVLTRSIVRPLRRAVRVAEAVAAGDLTSDIEARSTDETGQLLCALQTMNRNLGGMVSEVRHGTEAIAATAAQIAAGNLDLSSRTEFQAGSLEETA